MSKAAFDELKSGFINEKEGVVRCMIPSGFEQLIEAFVLIDDELTVKFVVKLKSVRRGHKQFGSTIAIHCETAFEYNGNPISDKANPIVLAVGNNAAFASRQFSRINLTPESITAGITIQFGLQIGLLDGLEFNVSPNNNPTLQSRITPLNIGGSKPKVHEILTKLLNSKENIGEVTEILAKGTFRLADFSVFDGYYRYTPHDRAICKDIVQLGVAKLRREELECRNLLIWSKSGMGKSSLVREIVKELGLDPKDSIKEINCAACRTERELTNFIDRNKKISGPKIVLFDEADSALKGEDVIYKQLMPFLEQKSSGASRWLTIIIGSTGESPQEIAEGMKSKFKGADVLGRVLEWNLVAIPIASFGDRMLAFCSGVLGNERECLLMQTAALAGALLSQDMRGAAELGAHARKKAKNLETSIVNLIHVARGDGEFLRVMSALGDLSNAISANELAVFR